ncbi:MAG TPA: type I pantothenate kinase [Acidimicrobiia bacterium]|nr:type I pantothenate kinase [Acidimicrobiia bacterium]
MTGRGAHDESVDPFVEFDRAAWAALRAATPLTLDEGDLDALRGINDDLALDEVVDVYLPLSRLLNLRVAASRELHAVTQTFLGRLHAPVPFVIGVAGSVAVGKSTTARVLQALLARWPHHPRVDLVTTDGFLHPNAVLEARGMMNRKGFPESYDVKALLRFLAALKAGDPEVRAPVYSHLVYDIVPDAEIVVRAPDLVIVEGLNVLQVPPARPGREPQVTVSDYFDFTIYVDADEADIERWYVERFLALRSTAFTDTRSFFHHFTQYSEEESVEIARSIWREVNWVNLHENIAPTRGRADLVLEKGPDHAARRVWLRKL